MHTPLSSLKHGLWTDSICVVVTVFCSRCILIFTPIQVQERACDHMHYNQTAGRATFLSPATWVRNRELDLSDYDRTHGWNASGSEAIHKSSKDREPPFDPRHRIDHKNHWNEKYLIAKKWNPLSHDQIIDSPRASGTSQEPELHHEQIGAG